MDRKDFFLWLLVLVIVIIIACTIVLLPPHSSSNVQFIGSYEAIMPPDSQLVLWVPYGKSTEKFILNYDGEIFSYTDNLFNHDEMAIESGCQKVSLVLFWDIQVCSDSSDLTVTWDWPIYADKP